MEMNLQNQSMTRTKNINNNDAIFGNVKRRNSSQSKCPSNANNESESFVDRVRRLRKEKLAANSNKLTIATPINVTLDKCDDPPSNNSYNFFQNHNSNQATPFQYSKLNDARKRFTLKDNTAQINSKPKEILKPTHLNNDVVPTQPQLKSSVKPSPIYDASSNKKPRPNVSGSVHLTSSIKNEELNDVETPKLINAVENKNIELEPDVKVLNSNDVLSKGQHLSTESSETSAATTSIVKMEKVPSQNIDPSDSKSKHECTLPLHIGVKHGDINSVKRLLLDGVNVNSKDVNGCLPIHEAMREGEHALDIVRLLVEHRADINGKSDQGSTALHGAVAFLSQDIIDYLLINGADPTIENSFGKSPLDIASMSEFQKNKHIYQILSCFLPETKQEEMRERDGRIKTTVTRPTM